MVLPPLELFSLRRELPCCRAALSVFGGLLFGFFRVLCEPSCRFGPLVSAGFTFPRVGRIHGFKHRIAGTAFWAARRSPRELDLRRFLVLRRADRRGPEFEDFPPCAHPRRWRVVHQAVRPNSQYLLVSGPLRAALLLLASRTRITASSMCSHEVCRTPRRSPARLERVPAHVTERQAQWPPVQAWGRVLFVLCPLYAAPEGRASAFRRRAPAEPVPSDRRNRRLS